MSTSTKIAEMVEVSQSLRTTLKAIDAIKMDCMADIHVQFAIDLIEEEIGLRQAAMSGPLSAGDSSPSL